MSEDLASLFLSSLTYQKVLLSDGNNCASGPEMGSSHVCSHAYLSSPLHSFEARLDGDENISDACCLIIQQHL